VATRRAAEGGTLPERRAHYAGAAGTLALAWIATVGLGALAGSLAPAAAAHLGVAVPLCLVALVVPHLRQPGGVAAVGSAATVAAVTQGWPGGTGLLLAMAVAAAAGVSVAARGVGAEPAGAERAGAERASTQRAAADRASTHRAAADQARTQAAGAGTEPRGERAGAGPAAAERAGADRW
jgi:hypothetical protein